MLRKDKIIMTTSIINSITGYQKVSVTNHVNNATIIATYEKIPDSLITSIKNILPLPEKCIVNDEPKVTIIDKIGNACKGYDKQLKAINLQCCGS